jgi:RimJ/RimL family protein N-acetyltransferase
MTTILETDRMLLREWTVDDADALFAIMGDPDVARFLGATGQPHPNVEHTRERLQRAVARERAANGCGNWAAVDKASGEIIGGGGLEVLEGGPDVEVFYHFRKASWGQGYATELTRGLIDYAFTALDMPRVVGVAYPDNPASHHVMTKAGMRHEGQRHVYDHDLEYFVIERD